MVSFIDLITWFRLTLPVAFVFALLDIVCYLLEFIVVSMFQMHGFFYHMFGWYTSGYNLFLKSDILCSTPTTHNITY